MGIKNILRYPRNVAFQRKICVYLDGGSVHITFQISFPFERFAKDDSLFEQEHAALDRLLLKLSVGYVKCVLDQKFTLVVQVTLKKKEKKATTCLKEI